MTNKKTYKEIENEKKRGRKRFLERIAETKDADKEIREFCPEDASLPLNDEHPTGVLK